MPNIKSQKDPDVAWFIEKYDYKNKDADWKNSKDAIQRGMQKGCLSSSSIVYPFCARPCRILDVTFIIAGTAATFQTCFGKNKTTPQKRLLLRGCC